MVEYTFLYPNLTGLLVEMGKKLKVSYSPQSELWAAGEEALWEAGVDFEVAYSPLTYTIAYRGMIAWLRKDTRSFIPPYDTSFGEETKTRDTWSPAHTEDYGKVKKITRKEEIYPSGN